MRALWRTAKALFRRHPTIHYWPTGGASLQVGDQLVPLARAPAGWRVAGIFALILLPALAQAQVPLQPDWSNPGHVYGPVDGVAPLWSQAPAAVEPEPPPPNLRLSILGGGLASLSADASGVVPFARIGAEARLTKTERGPSLHVVVDLTAEPGDSVTIEDPQTYRGIEFSAGVSQPLGGPLLFSTYAEIGFVSRLPSDPAPRDRTAKWVSAGLLFQTKGREHRLALGLGRDQRLNGSWVTAVQVSGQVKLRESKGISVYLVGSAVLSLEVPLPAGSTFAGYSPPRDSVRCGIALGV